jgi:crossover junction endodeoxyribonuclease RusA
VNAPFVMPWPPTVNHYWRFTSKGVLISDQGRQYREVVAVLALENLWPRFPTERVKVTIEAWMPDRRRRDLDNILKSLLDSLTHAGVWTDDSQVDDLRIYRAPRIGGMCKVEIAEISAEGNP